MRPLEVELANGTTDSYPTNSSNESHEITPHPDGSITIARIPQDGCGSVLEEVAVAHYAHGEWLTTHE